jgi:hypothetical protein
MDCKGCENLKLLASEHTCIGNPDPIPYGVNKVHADYFARTYTNMPMLEATGDKLERIGVADDGA